MIFVVVFFIIDRVEFVEEFIDLLFEDVKLFVVGYVLDIFFERFLSLEYLEFVRKIGFFVFLECLKVKVVCYFLKFYDYEGVWNFVFFTSDFYLCFFVFGSIVIEKFKEGDIDGVIDVVFEVKDLRWGLWLFSEILVKIVEF